MTDNKYQNGKIYKITGTDDSMVYIGGTTKTLARRFTLHRSDYKRWKSGKFKKTTVYAIFDKFGVDNCKIELVENYPCSTRNELERREGQNIKNTIGCVNRIIAGRKRIEYWVDNKDKMAIKNKEYREDNKVRIQKIKTEQLICECGCISTNCNIQRHRKSQQHMEIMHGKTACKLCKVNCNYEEHKKLADHKFNLIEWLCA